MHFNWPIRIKYNLPFPSKAVSLVAAECEHNEMNTYADVSIQVAAQTMADHRYNNRPTTTRFWGPHRYTAACLPMRIGWVTCWERFRHLCSHSHTRRRKGNVRWASGSDENGRSLVQNQNQNFSVEKINSTCVPKVCSYREIYRGVGMIRGDSRPAVGQ